MRKAALVAILFALAIVTASLAVSSGSDHLAMPVPVKSDVG